MGEIADEHYDAIMDSEMGFYRCSPRRNPSCLRCGKTDLTWSRVGETWQLFEHRGLHFVAHLCDRKKTVAAFDNLDA